MGLRKLGAVHTLASDQRGTSDYSLAFSRRLSQALQNFDQLSFLSDFSSCALLAFHSAAHFVSRPFWAAFASFAGLASTSAGVSMAGGAGAADFGGLRLRMRWNCLVVLLG